MWESVIKGFILFFLWNICVYKFDGFIRGFRDVGYLGKKKYRGN